MSIDWVTVSAQIVNFLVLVWLLKRFLYQPVLTAMHRREEDIAARLKTVSDSQFMTQQQRQELDEETQRFEQQKNDLVQNALEEARREVAEMLESARNDVGERRKVWREQLQEEQTAFLESLRHEGALSVVEIARRLVEDLANVAFEEEVVAVFIARLQQDSSRLRELLMASTSPVQITTAFVLDAELQQQLIKVIRDLGGVDVEVRFTESAALVCGIELFVGGHRVGWNVAEYCQTLGERVARSITLPPLAVGLSEC